MKCLIYARVSTKRQVDEGRSIGDQIKICRRYAKDNGYDVEGVFEDGGRSATNMRRVALTDTIARCQKKDIDSLLVFDTDRLARNPTDHLQIKAILKQAGTKIIAVNQPSLSEDTPEGNLVDLIVAGINGFQSEITGRKVLKSMQEKFRDGWYPREAPLGFLNNNIGTDKKPERIIEIHPEKGPLIKKAFEMFATGLYGAEKINDKLFKMGLVTKKGKRVSRAEFARILKNPFYYGFMRFAGEEKMGNHKPLITKDLFDQCQKVFLEHNRGADRSRKFSFIVRGFVRCAICGHKYTAEHHTNKKSYYHCPSAKHSNKKQNIEVSALEKQVENLFDNLKLPDKFILEIIEKAKEIIGRSHKKVSEERRILNIRKEKLEQRLHNAEIQFADREIPLEVYQRLSRDAEKEIKDVNDELAKLEVGRKENVLLFERLVQMGNNIGNAYREAPEELKRSYLNLFWEEIEVKDRKIKKAVPTKLYTELFPDYNFAQTNKLTSNHIIITTGSWRAVWDSDPRRSP